ncbi:cell division protein PerM [Microbacterium timonense]|uniref:cell division protein PerM n=1 Tax=Microbacterium timonense TaxID=2086576 RepID=UPI000D10474E|nr:DUF6350 family protein [Microbacterium timonense]
MHRLIVALLATVDAAIAVAVGLAAALAPLTLLWVFGFGGTAEWGALWPAAASVWHLGNLVPLTVTLPPEYLAATGIDGAAASFVLSLAPLAFAGFTAIFAARSGVRASRAEAWVTGVVTSTAVFTALAAAVASTSANPVASAEPWQAIIVPTLVFAVPAFVGAVVTEWAEAGTGVVAGLRDRIEALPRGWGVVPALIARGGAVVGVGLVGLGAVAAAVALFARAGQIVALFEAGDVDALGATVLTLGQLAYVPTLAVWGMSFVAGPGFAVGADTAVSPAGTQVGVVPALPALGAVPDSTTSWLLLLALLPVALGAFAGWIVRSRLVRRDGGAPVGTRAAASAQTPPSSRFDATKTAALTGLLSGSTAREDPDPEESVLVPAAADEDPMGARLAITAGIALVAGALAALLAFAASGALGPGRLTEFGPAPGPVAMAVGFEVLVGAAIVLLAPRRVGGKRTPSAAAWPAASAETPAVRTEPPTDAPESTRDAFDRPEAITEPIELPRQF